MINKIDASDEIDFTINHLLNLELLSSLSDKDRVYPDVIDFIQAPVERFCHRILFDLIDLLW